MKFETIILPGGKPVQVQSNGVTVWVNNSFACIGRFGRHGIDIHRVSEESISIGECLFCTHQEVTPEDWETFKQKMAEFYGATITDDHKPERFRVS